ncbi:MAG: M56 family metallopeptidase [Verrucomicrobiales bacterium]|nr:M56 family metallopeptidase [Verrucomicrobiales bacterium]
MIELLDFLQIVKEQMVRSSLVVLGLILLHYALGKYLAPKWRYLICVFGAIWLLVPATPPSVTSLWSLIPQPDTATFQSERLDKIPSLFPAVPVETADDSPLIPEQHTTENPIPAIDPKPTWVPLQSDIVLLTVASIWTGGILLYALFRFPVWLPFFRTIRKAQSLENERLTRLLSEAKATMAITKTIRLLRNPQLRSPAITGLIRPAILLPHGFENELTDEQIRHVFLHELAHLSRRDLLTGLFIHSAVILNWPNPLAWWLAKLSRQDAEMATDDKVIAKLARPEDRHSYGETLLSVARSLTVRKSFFPLPSTGMASSSRSNLEKRIRYIAEAHSPHSRWVTHIAITLAVLLGCVVGLSPSAAQSPLPVKENQRIDDTLQALKSIIIPSVEFSDTEISEVLRFFEKSSVLPDGTTIKISMRREIREQYKDGKITLRLTNVPFPEALRYTTQLAGLTYRIESENIVIIPVSEARDLYTNVYPVPPTFLHSESQNDPFEKGDPNQKILKRTKTAKQVLEEAGITFSEGTSAIYNPANSQLIIRNTLSEMQLVEAYIDSIIQEVEKQIYITAKVVVADDPYANLFENAASNPPPGVSRTLEESETIDGYLFGDTILKQLKEALNKSAEIAAKGIENFSAPIVLTSPQLQVLLRTMNAKKDVGITDMPSIIVRSGQRGVIAGELVGLGLDPVLGADNNHIDINFSARYLGENENLLPRKSEQITIKPGESILLHGKPGEKKHLIVVVKATIVDPAGRPISKAATSRINKEANWQDKVKIADKLALEGSRLLSAGEYKAAESKYREALRILPDYPLTDPRKKAYLEQWYKTLKALE